MVVIPSVPMWPPFQWQSTLLETKINSRQGLSRNNIGNFSESNSWKHFAGSATNFGPSNTLHKVRDREVRTSGGSVFETFCRLIPLTGALE